VSTAWKPQGAPFCWQPKEAFRLIEETLEHPASAALVYVALTRIACNEGAKKFSKPTGYIAKLAYLSRRTICTQLPELERIGLVNIERRPLPGTKARDAHRYTLVNVSHKVAQPLHKDVAQPLHEGCAKLERELCAVSREQYNNNSKPSKTEITADWLSGLSTDLAYKGISLDSELSKARRWCSENSRQCTRRFFVNWLNRCRPQTATPGAAAVQPTTADEILRAAL
jgi:hypothetical protein